MNENRLTDKRMWNSKWMNTILPAELSIKDRGEKSFITLFEEYLQQEYLSKNNKSVLEVGCSPGRFMVFLSKQYNYFPVGIEYSEEGVNLTKANLTLHGIKGEVIWGDFLSYNFDRQFDLVISSGFAEHFVKNLDKVMKKHASLVKENGKLFLSFPNFRYLNYFFLSIFRRNMLKIHNLKVMKKSFFVDFAKAYKFNILYLGYFGGIHPSGVKLTNKQRVSWADKLIMNFIDNKIDRNKLLENCNSKYFSRYVGAFFEKNSR